MCYFGKHVWRRVKVRGWEKFAYAHFACRNCSATRIEEVTPGETIVI